MEKIEEEVSAHTVSFREFLSTSSAAIACEVLARRIVHLAEPDRVKDIMAKRYQHRQIDGDESEMSSALEMAIDQHWYVIHCHSYSLFPNFYYLTTVVSL